VHVVEARQAATDCYGRSMRVASRELRNDTAGVLRRVSAGESLEITVNGEAVAELRPLRSRRSHWTARADVLARLADVQADPGLAADLQALNGDTSELGPIR
jgi:prevent-host-death family protein